MSHTSHRQDGENTRPTQSLQATSVASSGHGVALLPIAALMLALSMNTWAQTAPATPVAAETTDSNTLKTVTVKEKAEASEGKDAIRATTTTVGKGNQALRDIPQSITVVTEKNSSLTAISTP